MRIKKVSQTTPTTAQVEHQYSDSTENTYDCDYINNHSVTVSATEPTDKTKVWIKYSKNKYDNNSMIELTDQFRNWSNGSISSASSYVGIKVPVKPNTTYTFSTDIQRSSYSNLCFYQNDTYKSGLIFTSGNQFTVPAGCNYVTIAVENNYNWIQIEEGTTATQYEEYIGDAVYVLVGQIYKRLY